MPHTNYTKEEIVRRGKLLYEQQIRPDVEAIGLGPVLVINVETGEYEMGTDYLSASNRAAAKYLGAPLYAMRVGEANREHLGMRSPVKARA